MAPTAVVHAIWHIKPRLVRQGCVANPHDTCGYRCAYRLAPDPKFIGFICSTLDAIEVDLHASPHTGEFCHGDTPTMADICLASHLIAAQFFKCDTSGYQECQRVFANCMAIPAFADSHPLKQPGAPA